MKRKVDVVLCVMVTSIIQVHSRTHKFIQENVWLKSEKWWKLIVRKVRLLIPDLVSYTTKIYTVGSVVLKNTKTVWPNAVNFDKLTSQVWPALTNFGPSTSLELLELRIKMQLAQNYIDYEPHWSKMLEVVIILALDFNQMFFKIRAINIFCQPLFSSADLQPTPSRIGHNRRIGTTIESLRF